MKSCKVLSIVFSVAVLTMFWSGIVFGQTNTFPNRGSVGIGELSPKASLHIANDLAIKANPSAWNIAAGKGIYLRYSLSGRQDEAYIQSIDRRSQRRFPMVIEASRFFFKGGSVGIGVNLPRHPLQMASGAHVTAGGVWADASSRASKENINPLTTVEAISALAQLDPVKFNYIVDKSEAHVGFIAEDVPELLANKDRKSLSPMDMVAVLTKVVQHQQLAIEQLKQEIDSLKVKNK